MPSLQTRQPLGGLNGKTSEPKDPSPLRRWLSSGAKAEGMGYRRPRVRGAPVMPNSDGPRGLAPRASLEREPTATLPGPDGRRQWRPVV